MTYPPCPRCGQPVTRTMVAGPTEISAGPCGCSLSQSDERTLTFGSASGSLEGRPCTAISDPPEPNGTPAATLMAETVLGSGMASLSQLEESDVPWKSAPEHARETARALNYPTNGRVWMTAVQYATDHGLNGGTGQQPSTIGAAAVYLCGLLFNNKRSQHEVANAAGISPLALRNAYQRIARAEGFHV